VTSTYNRLFLLLGLFGFAGLIFLCYHQRASNLVYERKDVSRYQYPKPRHDIRGFRFDGTHEGKRTISIKADRFSIDKKKLGFFRFGLMNVARLENAFIHIYGSGLSGERSDDLAKSQKAPSPLTGEGWGEGEKRGNGTFCETIKPDESHSNVKSWQSLTFKDIFSKDALPSFPVKRISSIVVEPVSVTLHDEESVVTRISAALATIRLRKRNIF